jgi:hypothetical protein
MKGSHFVLSMFRSLIFVHKILLQYELVGNIPYYFWNGEGGF